MVDRVRLAAQAGEGGARIGEGVDANAEPRDAIAAGDTDEAKGENDGQRDGDGLSGDWREDAEVEDDNDGDEEPENDEEFALGDEVSLAGFVDQLRDVAHGAMHGQILEAPVDHQAEDQAEDAKENAEEQQCVAVDAEELHLAQIGKLQRCFAACFLGALSEGGCGGEQGSDHRGRSEFCESTS